MTKLTVLIDGPSKIIDLQESVLTSMENSHIFLKKAYIMWELYNVSSKRGNYYTYNKQHLKRINTGYHTFQDLKNHLESKWCIISVTQA